MCWWTTIATWYLDDQVTKIQILNSQNLAKVHLYLLHSSRYSDNFLDCRAESLPVIIPVNNITDSNISCRFAPFPDIRLHDLCHINHKSGSKLDIKTNITELKEELSSKLLFDVSLNPNIHQIIHQWSKDNSIKLHSSKQPKVAKRTVLIISDNVTTALQCTRRFEANQGSLQYSCIFAFQKGKLRSTEIHFEKT